MNSLRDALFTDLYELTMAACYFDRKMFAPATFSLYIRKYGPHRSYFVSAGLEEVLDFLESFHFTQDELDFLKSTGLFSEDFLHYLQRMRFTGEVWRVFYQKRAAEAIQWADRHGIAPASSDRNRIALLLVDVQNTFCTPGFELFVSGRSGTGAVDDNRRLCEFIYRNLGIITRIIPTMDTHQAMQIFHSIILVNERGNHPDPFTLLSPGRLHIPCRHSGSHGLHGSCRQSLPPFGRCRNAGGSLR